MQNLPEVKQKHSTSSSSPNWHQFSKELIAIMESSLDKFFDHQGVLSLHKKSSIKECEHNSEHPVNKTEMSSIRQLVRILPKTIKDFTNYNEKIVPKNLNLVTT